LKAETSSDPSASRSRFNELLRKSEEKSGSKIILALDLPYRKSTENLLADSLSILDQVSDFVCAVKINFHLIIPLSIQEIFRVNELVHSKGLVSIADIKLNDIDNTNEIATRYLWDSGFDGVIVNPFVGFKGSLDIVYKTCHSAGKGVISLAYMSHPGADEGFGIETKDGHTFFDLMLDRANEWGSDGVILGSTRSDKIRQARAKLNKSIKIISPGSGAQGGDPIESLKSGTDYLIYGRSIVSAPKPSEAARQIYEKLKKLPA
jgi:orotidine-5'-phosphate decarboxylase